MFDIDGVIRDVTNSYRLSIQETVNLFSSWRPSVQDIDALKAEGCWNNDWDVSLELIKKALNQKGNTQKCPTRNEVITVFNKFYFGCSPNKPSREWTGFINNEKLLVNKMFFEELYSQGILFGFVSGAEPPSIKFVLENKLSLNNPIFIGMGQAPEKPDPRGFISIMEQLIQKPLGSDIAPIGYLGDTVADILMIKNARKLIPSQKFLSFGIAPPHLHKSQNKTQRFNYENALKEAGADYIIQKTPDITDAFFRAIATN